MCALFAATYPERTAALIMGGSDARRLWAPDYTWGTPRDTWDEFVDSVVRNWGGAVGLEVRAPSLAGDPQLRAWWARYVRQSASPSAARARIAGIAKSGEVLVSNTVKDLKGVPGEAHLFAVDRGGTAAA